MMATDTGGASDARLKMPGHAAFYTTKTQQRMLSMLKADMGVEMWEALHDPGVTEVSANSDGTVWVDRIGQGRVLAMESVAPERIYSILTIVADAKGEQIGDANPSFDALVPGLMFRFVGTLPPLTPAPSFTIRKKPSRIIGLDEYEASKIITPAQKAALQRCAVERDNVVVAGGTNSGKTTFGNAMLQTMALTGHRIVTIEDTPELQNPALDQESLFTVPGVRSMQDCLKMALRMHPDRIVFGEVRGAEVRDMLMAWNTGHRGGFCTIHADSVLDALYRIEEMLETIPNYQPRPRSIARTVNVIAFITGTNDVVTYPAGRYIPELMRVTGWSTEHGYNLESIG
jgi:P-type conjugative transfer ATPase TrbB